MKSAGSTLLHHDKVFVAEPTTEQAQQEVLDLVHPHVTPHFPDRFRQDCKGIAISGHPALSTADMRAMPPLKAASLLVQEDLILMRRGDNGWRLAAGSLCFPSSWTLTEKFGRPLQEIRRPVPGFGPDTRNNELINRMFDRLHQPVLRSTGRSKRAMRFTTRSPMRVASNGPRRGRRDSAMPI